MTTNKSISFKIFIVVISIVAIAFLAEILFSHYQVDIKYARGIAFIMFIALSFTTVGIYTGFKHQAEEKKAKIQNRIGLIGNLTVFLFTIVVMAIAAFTQAG